MEGVDGGEVLESECVEVCPRLLEGSEDAIAQTPESVERFNLLAEGEGPRLIEEMPMGQKVNWASNSICLRSL